MSSCILEHTFPFIHSVRRLHVGLFARHITIIPLRACCLIFIWYLEMPGRMLIVTSMDFLLL